MVDSAVMRYFEASERSATRLVDAVDRVMAHADGARRLACGRTPTPPRTPPAPGGSAPQGIGLCRTEHMFLGERRKLVER